MAAFIRRFLEEPGDEILLEIESVNIIDLEPPAGIVGVGSGTAMLVGEFEDGPFERPLEPGGVTALTQPWDGNADHTGFGALGITRASVPANDCCAIEHGGEFWNGNGAIALHGKKFRRLIVVRVDTRVGEVRFTRLASLVGNTKVTWDLEPAQTLDLVVDGAAPVTATFTAAAATVTGAGAAFAAVAAGEWVTLGDGLDDDITVTFEAGDNSAAGVVARINAFFGYTFADLNAGQLRLTSRVRGTDGDVRVVAASAGTLVDLGLVAAVTPGTGNVANVDAVTVAELDAIVNAATGGDVRADRDPDGRVRLRNAATTDGTGTLELDGTSTAVDFEFPTDAEDDAAAATNTGGRIPAGTRVTDGVTTWVTMQTVVVPDGAAGAGPFANVPIRPATDDGTALGGLVSAVDTVTDSLFAAFAVTNPLPVDAALSEAAVDAQYQAALDSTLNLNSVAREANLVWSARQSNNLRRMLRDNAVSASANGMFGRVAVTRAPMGTAIATARGTAEPGVGATRNQRLVYCWPQWRSFVPTIALRGVAGGDGFTDDGVIDIGADGFLVSVCSQLAPEENPGQLTGFLGAVVGLESAAPELTITDYTNLRGSGICGPRMDEGSPIYQSGVTSVDPTVNPNLRNIARRRMADFIQDSMARRAKAFSKKLSTRSRRNAIVGEQNAFLRGLLSPNNPDRARIEGYVLDTKNGNTKESLAAGLFRVITRVRTLPSLDSIAVQTQIGETVEVSELA